MIALNIFEIRDMMAQLLVYSAFDNFYLEDASVTTFANLKISGRRNTDWYDTDIKQQFPRLLYWKEVKAFLFQYIKGKKTPSSFSFSLKLCKEKAVDWLKDTAVLPFVQSGNMECFLHFRFEKGKLTLVTGCSQKEFTIERLPENVWDMSVKEYMKKINISYEES